MSKKYHFETRLIHSGTGVDPTTGSLVTPIHMTAAYQFHSTDQAEKRFMLEEDGPIYTRVGNPTVDNFEQRMTDLDNGVGAVATSSGMTAVGYSILNIANKGDNIIASPDLYGGVSNLFNNLLPNLGIEVRFVEHTHPENFYKAADEKTRCFFGETLPNPRLNIFPIREVGTIADKIGIPLIIDNTCATPYLCQPFKHGAHIAIYSTTKYICGHGTSIGGIVIDSGIFNWHKHRKRFPMLNEPDPSYHGLVWTNKFAEAAYIAKMRGTLLRDLGGCMSPMNAFLFSQGLETLSLRMDRHCSNASKVANFLVKHPKIQLVRYPGLDLNGSKELADKSMNGLYGAMVGIHLKSHLKGTKKFIDNLKLIHHAANIGDAKSLAVHPASTTHSQVPRDKRIKGGISDNYVRLCIGIEHIDDIISDISQALDKVPELQDAIFDQMSNQ